MCFLQERVNAVEKKSEELRAEFVKGETTSEKKKVNDWNRCLIVEHDTILEKSPFSLSWVLNNPARWLLLRLLHGNSHRRRSTRTGSSLGIDHNRAPRMVQFILPINIVDWIISGTFAVKAAAKSRSESKVEVAPVKSAMAPVSVILDDFELKRLSRNRKRRIGMQSARSWAMMRRTRRRMLKRARWRHFDGSAYASMFEGPIPRQERCRKFSTRGRSSHQKWVEFCPSPHCTNNYHGRELTVSE